MRRIFMVSIYIKGQTERVSALLYRLRNREREGDIQRKRHVPCALCHWRGCGARLSSRRLPIWCSSSPCYCHRYLSPAPRTVRSCGRRNPTVTWRPLLDLLPQQLRPLQLLRGRQFFSASPLRPLPLPADTRTKLLYYSCIKFKKK